MPTICAKCHHVRPADATVPDWQCPACGVAYVKAAEMADASRRPAVQRPVIYQAAPERGVSGFVKAGVTVAILAGVWAGMRYSAQHEGGSEVTQNATTEEELRTLARTVAADDVVIYTTVQCPYCHQAKQWMKQYGFPYTECKVDLVASCEQELRATGSSVVPTLLVKGHLSRGFDSEEFIAHLQM